MKQLEENKKPKESQELKYSKNEAHSSKQNINAMASSTSSNDDEPLPVPKNKAKILEKINLQKELFKAKYEGSKPKIQGHNEDSDDQCEDDSITNEIEAKINKAHFEDDLSIDAHEKKFINGLTKRFKFNWRKIAMHCVHLY